MSARKESYSCLPAFETDLNVTQHWGHHPARFLMWGGGRNIYWREEVFCFDAVPRFILSFDNQPTDRLTH